VSASVTIRVQPENFDVGTEWAALAGRIDGCTGAIAVFMGLVRDVAGDGSDVLELEHYPGMTERTIGEIVVRAKERWQLDDVLVIHRVGALLPRDPIVLVMVSSSHRAEAFAACEFIMDFLKTDAVFWKNESSSKGSRWVEATLGDRERQQEWDQDDLASRGR
jgi:molybdopterin synthase catalytic subunit|tara:strand:- start:155 stop:643 length:489 start_codon:yes stop_codon:yes gene_type:complete